MESCVINSALLMKIMVLIVLFSQPVHGWSIGAETTLRSTLASGYDTKVRPEEATTIFMAFQMTSIDSVNIKEQTFAVSGWWILEWDDPRLAWTPASHGNVESVLFSENDVWTPSIVVSNCVTDLSAIDEDTIPIRVYHDGSVSWHPPGIITTGCDLDTTHFPFDEQVCSLQVTSFGYTLEQVIVNSTRGLKFDYYSENGDWEILEVWDKFEAYVDTGLNYAKMTYYVKLKRLNTYHWLNIILPVVVSGLLLIFVFMLPVDSGEKMGYTLTCLLTYVVLLTLIAADLPTSAKHTSILEVYLTIVLIISGFTTFCSIVSIKLYQWPEEDYLPNWVIKLTKKCWPLVDWRKESVKKSSKRIYPLEEKYEKQQTIASPRGFANNKTNPEAKTPVRRLSIEPAGDDDYNEEDIDGKVVSIVMDSIFLRIYAIFLPIMTFVILVVLIAG